MGEYVVNKELCEKIDKLIADHKRELAERVEKLLERCESNESLDDILIKNTTTHRRKSTITDFRTIVRKLMLKSKDF